MASLSDFADVTIQAETRVATRVGFGVPMLVGYHTIGAAQGRRVDIFETAGDMLIAGHSVNGNLYKAAVALCAQPNRPPQFKVGRRVGLPAWTQRITPTAIVQGAIYRGTLDGVAWTYTVGASPTLSTVCTALAAAINAISTEPRGVVASGVSGTYVDLTASVAGDYPAVTVDIIGGQSVADLEDRTPLPGTSLQTDLAAIAAEDDDWYGLDVVDAKSKAQILDAAVWVAASKKLFVAHTFDSDVANPALSTDVASSLATLAYRNVATLYHRAGLGTSPAAAWLGRCLGYDAGSETWALKELVGVPADTVTTTQSNAIRNTKRANTYEFVVRPFAGFTRDGKVANGSFIDITRIVDWFEARVKEAAFGMIITDPKLPMTDAGLAAVGGAIRTVQAEALANGAIDPGSDWVTSPKRSQVIPTDRANRYAPGFRFGCVLSGAIHKVGVKGSLTI